MEEIITFLNHWWREGKVKENLAKDYRRECFNELLDLLNKRQIVIVYGLRRVGKTTLMYQLIQHLIKGGDEPLNILYFSFDKQIGEIKDLLSTYSKITGKDYERGRIFVFLDEIYKLDKWHEELKLLYDALPNVKFVVSGSASLKVEKEARRNLVGRAFYTEVMPLSLKEFFELKFNKKLENVKIWEEKLKTIFPTFLKNALPETIDLEPERSAEYIRELVLDKILFSDFPLSFKNVDVNLLQTLTEIFLSEPGMYLNIDSLSKDLRKSKNDIIFHIKLLEWGYIIKIVKNYRGSTVSASRKLRRVYPYHPLLINGMSKEIEESKLVECFVRSHLDADYYWKRGGREIDFVYNRIPVEVKYKERIRNEDFANMREFMKKFKSERGFLISKDKFDKLKINKKNIDVLPAWFFALKKVK